MASREQNQFAEAVSLEHGRARVSPIPGSEDVIVYGMNGMNRSTCEMRVRPDGTLAPSVRCSRCGTRLDPGEDGGCEVCLERAE